MSYVRDNTPQNKGYVPISARLERLPITRRLWLLVILVGLLYMQESLDLGVTGTISTVLYKFPGTTPFFIAFFGIATTVGLVIGMSFSGFLADKFGKKKVLLIGLLDLIGMSGVLAIIPANFPLLLTLRIIQGLGGGAVYVFPYTYLAEFTPKNRRGLFIGFIDLFFVFGYFLAPAISLYAIPFLPSSISWRVVFAIAFVPIVLYPLYYKYIPESPRWLEKQGRYAEADAIVSNFEQAALKQFKKELPPPVITKEILEVEEKKVKIREIFTKKYLKYSIPLWIYTSAMLSGFYVANIYAPTIFEAFGYKAFLALLLAMIMNGVMFFPKFGVMLLADRMSRKRLAMFLMFLSAVFSILLYEWHVSPILSVLFAMAVFWSVNSNSPLWRIFASEIYPTSARQTGTYLNEFVARLWSGVIFTFIVGYSIVSTSLKGPARLNAIYFTYLLVAIIAIIGAIAVYFLKEGVKKQLEEIEYEITTGVEITTREEVSK